MDDRRGVIVHNDKLSDFAGPEEDSPGLVET
jgi:hypothetical protein